MKLRIWILGLCVAAALPAGAQQVATRGDLNALLGGSAITDDFETYNIADGNAEVMGTPTLNAGSFVNGQGPGLVHPGAFYQDPSNNTLQWNGNSYFGLPSKTILADGSSGELDIFYTGFTQAAGFDALAFSGFGYTGVASFYDLGGAHLGDVTWTIANGGAETAFVGWQNAAGIGGVRIQSNAFSFSPIIDNHEYGNVVPEPATMAVLGLGLVAAFRRRRKA